MQILKSVGDWFHKAMNMADKFMGSPSASVTPMPGTDQLRKSLESGGFLPPSGTGATGQQVVSPAQPMQMQAPQPRPVMMPPDWIARQAQARAASQRIKLPPKK